MQRDADLIKEEFKTAGYSLPEGVLDDLVQDKIKAPTTSIKQPAKLQ